MFRAAIFSRAARMALAAICLSGLVAGCSMAGLSGFRPAPAAKAAAVAGVEPAPEAAPDGAPDATPVLTAEAPPVPLMRPETSDAFVPFAYAEQTAGSGGDINALITKYALFYDVPESLVRRVVAHESGFNPTARNGAFLGLMQIRHDTARTMGYTGPASGLLDAETNLKYGVKYLRGAYLVGGYNTDTAIRNYKRGYYYDAKRQGLLDEAGFY